MAVQRASDRNLTPQQRMYKLLGRMLQTDITDTQRKSLANEFEQIVAGRKINSTWLSDLGLKASTGVDNNMGYIDIYVPPEAIPAWYKKQKDPKMIEARPKVRFYLTMMDTHGSKTEGIGPVR